MARVLAPLLLAVALGGCRTAETPRWDPTSGAPLPARVRLDVIGHSQRRSLSCESCSASDLLGYYGLRVTEEEFLRGLPVSDNPDEGFVGDVDGPGEQLPPAGYGVHAAPVAARLTAIGLPARAVTGRDLGWLRREVAQGKPVILWATGQLDAPRPVRLTDRRGRSFTAVRGEHTYLVVGYAPGRFVLLDAATGEEKEVFAGGLDASWATLGRMAVVPVSPP